MYDIPQAISNLVGGKYDVMYAFNIVNKMVGLRGSFGYVPDNKILIAGLQTPPFDFIPIYIVHY